jgi:hypothetical protein
MKLSDILDLWKADAVIDDTAVDLESIKIPKLHEKYLRILSIERQVFKSLELEYNKLLLLKTEYYTQGPFGDEPEHWKMPRSGRIIKKDLEVYLNADEDLSPIATRVSLQNYKIQEIERIIKSISDRNYLLKNVIEWKKFLAGH